MPHIPTKLYTYHVANLRKVEAAVTQVTRQLRHSISISDQVIGNTYLILQLLLSGILAESRFGKQINENQVPEPIRTSVSKKKSLLLRCRALIDYGFRSHYGLARGSLLQRLPFTPKSRYREMLALVEEELRPILELRNRLAHGQWVYPLNEKGTHLEPRKQRQLSAENALSLQFKNTILRQLFAMIHDLVVSKRTFERDFDSNHEALTATKRMLVTASYSDWVNQMRQKYLRGEARRRALP